MHNYVVDCLVNGITTYIFLDPVTYMYITSSLTLTLAHIKAYIHIHTQSLNYLMGRAIFNEYENLFLSTSVARCFTLIQHYKQARGQVHLLGRTYKHYKNVSTSTSSTSKKYLSTYKKTFESI